MSNSFIWVLQRELIHFTRSPFKTMAFLLFISASLYGIQNGYVLYKKHLKQIVILHAQGNEKVDQVLGLYDKDLKAFKQRPHMDITTPMWALYYTPSTTTKSPSPLMPFAIGQAEQYGYYKEVSEWSTTFDNDLAEEIANPERLTIGTLDFGFVVLYLLPILAIILLYNVGGLETDLGFRQLIQSSVFSYKGWLLARFSFYLFVLIGLLLLIMLPYAALTGALRDELGAFGKFFLYVMLYVVVWFSLFYLISLSGRKSSYQALRMISLWLFFCVLIPGAIEQMASVQYPATYMTTYIDAKRDKTYEIWYLSTDSMYNNLLRLQPELAKTSHGKDSIIDPRIVSGSSCVLVNELMKGTAQSIENRNEEKNAFIRQTFWINPVSFFQNQMDALANNDYYAFQAFRNQIQSKIDTMANFRMYGYWDKTPITEEKYLEYVKALKDRERYQKN